MKLPNWQHNSGKDQKRTLKPQALRQAKKRRSALKKKLLFGAAVLGILSVQPANALTWKEFLNHSKTITTTTIIMTMVTTDTIIVLDDVVKW